MPPRYFRWIEPKTIPEQTTQDLSGFSPPFRSILFQRGICSLQNAENLLNPQELTWYKSHCLLQLNSACEIIKNTIPKNGKILVFGDYDADGITSTAVLTLALKKLSADVKPVIPHRFSSGYGLNKEWIKSFKEEGIELMITVDNGIRSHDSIEYARSVGIKVIVTDHHNPGKELPPAEAVINPKSPDETYPNKHLAGVGVVYKLVCALKEYYPEIDPADYMDLVAIGTIADVVPLVGENRYLVREGLAAINNKFYSRQSLRSLFGVANLLNQAIITSDISFQVAPRLNASGRLDIAENRYPLDLLLASDPAVCGKLAQEIEIHNFNRKQLSKELQSRIEKSLDPSDLERRIIFSFSEVNHLGVAGIAAGYMTGSFYLPTVVGRIGKEFTTASCRSIEEFNIINALDSCRELLVRYGGHALAAGFTIKNDKLPQLQACLTDQAKSQLSGLDLRPTLSIDAVIDLDQITNKLIDELKKLEPTGSFNSQPIFLTRKLRCLKKSLVGKNSDHLRLSVSNGKLNFNCIGFGLKEHFNSVDQPFDMVFNLSENHYRGNTEIQFQIADIKPSQIT